MKLMVNIETFKDKLNLKKNISNLQNTNTYSLLVKSNLDWIVKVLDKFYFRLDYNSIWSNLCLIGLVRNLILIVLEGIKVLEEIYLDLIIFLFCNPILFTSISISDGRHCGIGGSVGHKTCFKRQSAIWEFFWNFSETSLSELVFVCDISLNN